MKIVENVKSIVTPIVEGLDLRLVDVEYVKKIDGMHLVVYIDNENGTTIDDCEKVHQAINDVIDEANPTDDASYILDVSSYGLDKPIKYDWQFERYNGCKVEVRLYSKLNGKKDFVGILVGHDDKSTTISVDGEQMSFDNSTVALILPYIEF